MARMTEELERLLDWKMGFDNPTFNHNQVTRYYACFIRVIRKHRLDECASIPAVDVRRLQFRFLSTLFANPYKSVSMAAGGRVDRVSDLRADKVVKLLNGSYELSHNPLFPNRRQNSTA
jgi:hypothetical protein